MAKKINFDLFLGKKFKLLPSQKKILKHILENKHNRLTLLNPNRYFGKRTMMAVLKRAKNARQLDEIEFIKYFDKNGSDKNGTYMATKKNAVWPDDYEKINDLPIENTHGFIKKEVISREEFRKRYSS